MSELCERRLVADSEVVSPGLRDLDEYCGDGRNGDESQKRIALAHPSTEIEACVGMFDILTLRGRAEGLQA